MSETVASADSYEAYYVQAPTDPLLKPADVVFTQADGGGLISKIILWGTRTWNEPRSRASHVALVAIPEADVTLTNLIEQTWPRQRREHLDHYLQASSVVIYRLRLINDEERYRIVKLAEADLGKPYGIGNILWFGLDALLGKILSWPVVMIGRLFGRRWRGYEPRLFSRLNLLSPIVCSQTVAKYYSDIGFGFGNAWQTRDPDSMLDFCESHPEIFEKVFES